MSNASLQAIMNKVRRLTRRPSVQQLPDADLIEYINTFYTLDFPSWIKVSKLHNNFITNTTAFLDYIELPENMVLEIKTPMYVNGMQVFYTQSQNEFFTLYPQQIYNFQIGVGDGVTTTFQSGVAGITAIPSAPFLISNYPTVSFTSVDVNNNSLYAYDDVVNRPIPGNPAPTEAFLIGSAIPGSTIDYLSGNFLIAFPTAPALGQAIFANTQPNQSSQPIPAVPAPPTGQVLVNNAPPDTILYYNSTLYFRPVPTTPYEVKIEQDFTPTDLDAVLNNVPLLNQWWQYIAYGAALKVLEDYVDPDTAAIITPGFRNQERLVMRRVLNQLSQQRAVTRYVEPVMYQGYGWPYLQQ